MAMTTNARNTVKLTKYSDVIREHAAAAAITPGCLIEIVPGADTVRKHATAGGNVCPIMFALEDELQGKGLDDDYAAADRVQCWIPGRGDVVYAVLNDGQSVHEGDKLESAGNGYLTEHVADVESPGVLTVYPNQIVAIALEACDCSESSGGESSGTLEFAKRFKG